MPPELTWLSTYGWAGILIWLASDKVLPLFKEWFLPAQAEERKARLAADQAERERKARLDERQVQVMDRFDTTLREIATTLVGIHHRQDAVERDVEVIRSTVTLLADRQTNGKRRAIHEEKAG